jgi:long-subunit fatty acid transport protein
VRLSVVVTTLAGAVTVAATAAADGGYYGGALGARAAGRSGAFVARADDPTAVFYNPAGLANVGRFVFMAGNRTSYNSYAYTRAPTEDWGNETIPGVSAPLVSFAEVRNGTPWQTLEPLLAVASNLGLPDWGFALAAFAPPGASKFDFPRGNGLNDGQRYMMLSREAIILNYTASAAWKYRDIFGVGVSAVWIAVPRLDYSLLIDGNPFAETVNPVSSPLDMRAETKGHDWFTPNAILGAWYRPAPFLQFGLAGQVIPTSIETNSTLTVTPLDTSAGLVELKRDGPGGFLPANDVHVILPLPLMARVGARYRGLAGGREIFDIELDVEYETWSRVNQFTLQTNNLFAEFPGAEPPNLGAIGIPKRWRDTVTFKLGGDAVVIPDRLALRAGAFYETAVAAPAYQNVDFPGGPMLGGSIGSSLVLGHWEVAIAYQLRHMMAVNVSEDEGRVYQQTPASACLPPFYENVECHDQFLRQPGPVVNAGSYRATSHFLALGLIYRFGSGARP